MPLHPEGPAPYASPASIITILAGYRERGFGTVFNAEVLARAGVPESLINRTIQSLKLLDLIHDDGSPTELFKDFKAIRGEDEYRAALKDWLYTVYSDVLQYADPTRDSVDRVAEAFRGYTPDGQRSRMVALMLGLFEYAGLIDQVRREPSAAPRRPQVKPKAKAREPRRSSGDEPAPIDRVPSPAPTPSGLPPELLGLLQSVPANRQWTKVRRDTFVTAFTTVLDYAIEVVPEVAARDQTWGDE